MTKEEIDNLKVGDVYTFYLTSNDRTIIKIVGDKVYYSTCGKSRSDYWNSIQFDFYVNPRSYTLIKKANNMTKNDLKEGMIVVCKNGKRYRLTGDRFIGECGWNSLNSYEDNLKSNGDSGFDIVQVHQPKSYPTSIKELLFVGDRIWMRPEEKEMTIAEIEAELGLKSGTLRIKK